MQFQIGIENGDENRSIAWVLGFPGCFAYGPDPDAAQAAAPQAISAYIDWVRAHTDHPWLEKGDIQVCVVDKWDVYFIDEGYNIVSPHESNHTWHIQKLLAQ